MHVTFREIKSALYFSFWIIFVIGVPFLCSIIYGYGIYYFLTPLICGCVVGTISGFPPARSFLACFLAFFIMGMLSTSNPSEYLGLLLLSSLLGICSGLIASVCAILRRIILRSKSEQLRLVTWQWALLVGGGSLLGDFLLIPSQYIAVLQMHYFSIFFKSLAVTGFGLFAVGLYAGAYYNHAYKTLVKDVMKFSVSGHFVFLLCFALLFLARFVFWGAILFMPLMGLSFLLVLTGTLIGYRVRKGNPLAQAEI
jgi:hypothetical protein